jgi:hypothetical protein
MKTYLYFILIIIVLTSCTKEEENAILNITNFTTGTYYGIKSISDSGTHNESVDTITIKFDDSTYIYSGSGFLDYGRGNYILNNESIEFHDDIARIALYSWHWIIIGKYQFKTIDDSLILNQNGSYFQISCRLKKTTK